MTPSPNPYKTAEGQGAAVSNRRTETGDLPFHGKNDSVPKPFADLIDCEVGEEVGEEIGVVTINLGAGFFVRFIFRLTGDGDKCGDAILALAGPDLPGIKSLGGAAQVPFSNQSGFIAGGSRDIGLTWGAGSYRIDVCWPGRMTARLLVEIEFETKHLLRRMPSLTMRSMFGLGATLASRLP